MGVFNGQCESWCGVVREKRADGQGSPVLVRKSGQGEVNSFWQGMASGFLRQGFLWLISNFKFSPESFCATFRTYLMPKFPVNIC